MRGRRALSSSALAAASILALAVAGCGSSDDSSDSSAKSSTAAAPTSTAPKSASIMLEFPANASQIYWFSGMERGTILKDGIKAKTVLPDDPSTPVKALAAGRVDFALQLSTGAMVAKAQGADVKVVGTLENLPEGMLVLNDKIKSIADLKGKTIGLADATWERACMARELEKAGLTTKDVKIVNPGANLITPLLQGKLAGVNGSQYEQAIIKIAAKKDSRVIRFSDVCPETSIQILTTGKMIKEHPDTVKAMLKGLSDSMAYAMANPEAAEEIYSKKYPEQDRKSNLAQWKASIPTFCSKYSETKGLFYADPEQYQQLIDLTKEAGAIKESYNVDTLVDNSFLPQPPVTEPCANELYKTDPMSEIQ
jgi:putative hydroxymethylpyrimidine transport system substrate-binding protein